MANYWQTLINAKPAKSGNKSTFGDLKDFGTYKVKIASVKDAANGSKMLSAKTISGSTGIGTYVSTFYDLREVSDTVTEDQARASLDALTYLLAAVKADEPADGQSPLDLINDDLVGKEFMCKVKQNGNYWNIQKFSVADEIKEDPTVDLDLPGAEKKTSTTEVKDDFGF